VLLVNPSIRPNSPKCLLNVGLAYIASAINRAGIDLKILDVDAHRYSDDEVARMIREEQFDVAAVGDLVSHYRWVKWLAARSSRRCRGA
jgi:anaerobic magnesium-protoporphyrin IX monomethyl ester cyclase